MQSKSLFAVVLSPAMALALPTEPEPEPAVFACTAPSYLACCEDIIAGVGVDIPTALATGCENAIGGAPVLSGSCISEKIPICCAVAVDVQLGLNAGCTVPTKVSG